MANNAEDKTKEYETNRSCTDCIFLILFVLFWIGMVIVGAVAFSAGDIRRFARDTDYLGNICGVNGQPSQPTIVELAAIGAGTWDERTTLWYPVSPIDFGNANPQTAALEFLKMGICVKECPPFNTYASTIDALPTNERLKALQANPLGLAAIQRYSSPAELPNAIRMLYMAWYNSEESLHRCIPVVGGATAAGNDSRFEATLAQFAKAFGKTQFVQRGVAELDSSTAVIWICCALSCVVSLVVTALLRLFVRPIVFCLLILPFVALVILGLFLRQHGVEMKGSLNPIDVKYAPGFEYGGYVVLGVAVIYLVLNMWLLKRIRHAIKIIEMASQVMAAIRTLPLFPAIIFFLSLGIGAWCSAVGIHIHSATTLEAQQRSKGMDGLQVYNIFGFLWTLGFLNAVCFMIIAMVTVFWYFSIPGDGKSVGFECVLKALRFVVRFHLGTAAFGSLGSFIVAAIQLIRFFLSQVQIKLVAQAESPTTGIIKFFLSCVQCCLTFWERAVIYINKNGYIVCAITGKSFCRSAKMAFVLIIDNLPQIGSFSFITEWVLICTKAAITTLDLFIGFLLLTKTSLAEESVSVIPLLLIGFLSYAVASLYIHVFDAVIDTVFLCWCFDTETNNGITRPYFFSSDIGEVVHYFSEGDGASIRANLRRNQVSIENSPPYEPPYMGYPSIVVPSSDPQPTSTTTSIYQLQIENPPPHYIGNPSIAVPSSEPQPATASTPISLRQIGPTAITGPSVNKTFADSRFKAHYQNARPAQNQMNLLKLVDLFLVEVLSPKEVQRSAIDAFFGERLFQTIQPSDTATIAAQRLWTSFETVSVNGQNRELCSLLNEALRCDSLGIEAVAVFARTLNQGLVRPAHPFSPKTTFRGTGIPPEQQSIFVEFVGKHVRIPQFVATSIQKAVAVNFQRKVQPPLLPIMCTFNFPPEGCVNVYSVTSHLPTEDEALFTAYSAFEIAKCEFTANGGDIVFNVLPDNALVDEHLPLLTWV